MSDFMAKMQKNSISAGARPQTPLGELTALGELSRSPDPLARLRGLLLRRKRGRRERGRRLERGKAGKDREWREGVRRGREGKGGG